MKFVTFGADFWSFLCVFMKFTWGAKSPGKMSVESLSKEWDELSNEYTELEVIYNSLCIQWHSLNFLNFSTGNQQQILGTFGTAAFAATKMFQRHQTSALPNGTNCFLHKAVSIGDFLEFWNHFSWLVAQFLDLCSIPITTGNKQTANKVESLRTFLVSVSFIYFVCDLPVINVWNQQTSYFHF